MNRLSLSVRALFRGAVGVTLAATACLSLAPTAQAAPPPAFPDGTTISSSFTNSTPVSIPAAGTNTITSTINVSGLSGVIWDVDARTFITHTFASDLDMTLTSPGGSVVTLTTDNGSSFDNVFNGTLWDDDANPAAIPYTTNNGLVTDHSYTNLVPAAALIPEESLSSLMNTSPNGVWTLTISDDAAGDGGSLNSWGITLTTLAPVPPTAITTTNNIPTLAIPDGSSFAASTAFVSTPHTYICDVNVTTNITHTFAEDLDIALTSPGGSVVTLTTDNGGNNDNVFNGTLWDDSANPAGTVPYASNNGLVTDHVYANLVPVAALVPEEPLGAFIGENPNGTWTLRVADDLAGDLGTLVSWGLQVKSCPDTTPPTFTATPPNVMAAATPGGSTAIVAYPLPAATANIGTPTVTCLPASGSAFPIGATTVTCTARNVDPVTATTSFTVTVKSNPPFVPLNPTRVLDTRSGAKVGNAAGTGTPLTLSLFGQGGLPTSGIGAVALNVTVTNTENPTIGGGYVTVYPCGTPPNASNLNFTAGQTIPNSVIAPVSATGTVCFYVYGTTHLIADVSGYFPT